ncbi:MAG: YqgE/AlgH family protein [Deltaproteobacteria bacterium]|nr:YqgE/AlgH family protein [Deltaproteobacteria bacterium]
MEPSKASRLSSLRSLAPGFLVATPTLLDPNFTKTVVMLVEHSPQGAMGFVVNRKAPMSFRDLASSIGVDGSIDIPVLFGGPVSRTGWVIFDPNEVDPSLLRDAVLIDSRIGISASRRLLEGVRHAKHRFFAVGYAGWGEGQLDAELAQGTWIPLPLDPSIVFECPLSERWEKVLRAAGIDPLRIMAKPSVGVS